jgi:hypothetical protein
VYFTTTINGEEEGKALQTPTILQVEEFIRHIKASSFRGGLAARRGG